MEAREQVEEVRHSRRAFPTPKKSFVRLEREREGRLPILCHLTSSTAGISRPNRVAICWLLSLHYLPLQSRTN